MFFRRRRNAQAVRSSRNGWGPLDLALLDLDDRRFRSIAATLYARGETSDESQLGRPLAYSAGPPVLPGVAASISFSRYNAIALLGADSSISARSASWVRTRSTMEGASTRKWRRSAPRVSDGPKPSVPRGEPSRSAGHLVEVLIADTCSAVRVSSRLLTVNADRGAMTGRTRDCCPTHVRAAATADGAAPGRTTSMLRHTPTRRLS
jgi:hypothetical protein